MKTSCISVTVESSSTSESPFPRSDEVDVMLLDQALDELAALDPPLARLVELRYFGGLSVAETAEVLALSPATVKRHWQTARTWLRRRMTEGRG